MSTTPSSLPTPTPTRTPVVGTDEKSRLRNQHVSDNRVNFAGLVEKMSHEGEAFKHWQASNEAYLIAVKETGIVGSPTKTREEALSTARLARIAYLAPLDIATADARGKSSPGLLTSDEWAELAFSKTPALLQMANKTDDEYKAAVDKAIEATKKEYESFKGVITADQYQRGNEATQKRRMSFSKLVASGANWMYGRRAVTDAEKALRGESKTEATLAIEAETRARAKQIVGSDAAYVALSPEEKKKQEAKRVADEIKKIETDPKYVQDIEDREQLLDARKQAMLTNLANGQRGYTIGVDEMTLRVEGSMASLNYYEVDTAEHDKDNPGTPIGVSKKKVVDDTVNAANSALETSIIYDYHHHSRLHAEQYIGAGQEKNMGRFDAKLASSRHEVSKEQKEALTKLDENKNKKPEEPLTVNGIPCGQIATIEMYGMGSTWLDRLLGGTKLTDDIGKFFEGWMVENVAANKDAYAKQHNGAVLTPELMLLAYATGPTITVGDPPTTQPNANFVNGSPVNVMRITSFPVKYGVEATLRAFAEMKAMAEILGIAIHFDMDAIVTNSTSEDVSTAKKLKYAMLHHLGPADPMTHEAMTRVQKRNDLTGSLPEQRSPLIRKLAGNAVSAPEIGMTVGANTSGSAGITGKGEVLTGTGGPPTTTSSTLTSKPLTTPQEKSTLTLGTKI